MRSRTQPVQSPPPPDLRGMDPVQIAPRLANEGMKEIRDGLERCRGAL
jgi:hypothetical protein